MSKPTSAAMAAAVAVVFAVGCEQATPTQPKEDAAPLFFTEQATEASSAEIPTGELAPPTSATAKLIAADVAIAAAGPVIRIYQDEQPWFGLNRANATLVAAPPAGLGKILGVDYFIHPLADLALGIPPGTAVVLITSNSFGVPTQAATQNSVAAQAALTAFLAGGGKLIVDMGDNLFSGGFIAPGSVGTPTLIFPNPRDDATLTPATAGHPLVLGPDGAPGGGDDLDNGNIDACCFVAHGNLEQGITLPGDATPLMTAGFNGLQRTVMAEYCLGAGLVILDTNTKEFFGQQAVGSGPGFVMRNLFSYALTPETPCLILVDIDIKPGSDPNCFNNDGNGVIPVAILGSATFDVTQVDPSTVQLQGLSVASKGKSGKLMAHIEDVNGDGFDDLVIQIEDVAGTFTSGSGTATLTGNLFDGTPFEGSDDICVVPFAPPPPPPPPPPPDVEAPVISGLQPPDETPLFVWNPDLGVDYTAGSPAGIDITRTCPSTDAVNDCESLIFEAVDLGTGVEEVGCGLAYPNACDDANGDGNFIVAGIVDGPATCDGGAGCDDELLITDDAGVAADDMFQAYFCDGPNVDAPNCDATDDGVYTVRVLVSDQASPQNNVATVDYPFVLDTNPPVIGFGGVTGLNSSNAATVEFVLTANVVDRNGDGTALTDVTVNVSIEDITNGGADGDCTTLGDQLFTEAEVLVSPNDDTSGLTVSVDVTSQVNNNGGDMDQTFTADNQGGNLGLGDYTYCFLITADDGAERKDGTDDGTDINSVAGKDFNWQ